MSTRRTDAFRTCSRCGGPLRSNSTTGICLRNPGCRKSARQAKSGDARARSRAYQRALPPERRQANNLRGSHGVSPAEKQALLDAQEGCCYLCGDPLDYELAVIDHDHKCCADVTKTGTRRTTSCAYCRRGLACGRCNTLIGMAGDDAEKLHRIADNLALALTSVRVRQAMKPQQAELFSPWAAVPSAAPAQGTAPTGNGNDKEAAR